MDGARREHEDGGHDQAGQPDGQGARRLLALQDEGRREDRVGEQDHDHDPEGLIGAAIA